MTYFTNVPRIYYDYNIGAVNETKIIRDISVNVRFKQQLLDSITMYEEYDILDGETPDKISEKIYGTPLYHWIIMLLNERFDYIEDFPLSMEQLERKTIDTYGINNRDAVHHYENSARKVLTSTQPYIDPYAIQNKILCSLDFQSNTITSAVAGDFAVLRDGITTDYHVAGIGLPYATVVVNSIIGTSSIIVDHSASETIVTELTFTHMIDPMRTASPVTNFEYEMKLNESKRRIKLIHPSQIAPILVQMDALNG